MPSERARTLVRGAVDYHVHVAPDFVARRITDVDLARRCLETGQAGFGLKSHYTPTTERAQVVAAAVPGVVVLGTITLNRAVGGLNPLAVEVAARQGARDRLVPDRLVGERAGRGPPARCAREGARLGPVRAVPSRDRPRLRARAGRRRAGRASARGARGARRRRAPRPRPVHRAPRPRRGLPARRGGGEAWRPRHRRDASRVPLAVHLAGRPARARGDGRAHGAGLHDTAHGQGVVGAGLRGHPRRSDRSGRSGRRTSARSRTHPSRTASR